MLQPIGKQLARDAQCSTILHQADPLEIRHFGAADSLIDPTHNVAQDGLRIQIELCLDFFNTERPLEQRQLQQLLSERLGLDLGAP